MGLFQSIGDLANTKLRKRKWAYQMSQAQGAIDNVTRAKAFREKEDPREHAHLKQTAWARGLGKSSIADQDKERLEFIHQQRRESLAQAEDTARKYMRYLKKAKKHETTSMWLGLLDGVLSIAAGAGGGAQSQQGVSAPEYSYGGGGAGDYNYGEWSQWG